MMRMGAVPNRATAGVVFLHGRGGTAADILGLGQSLALPDLAMIAPEAPGRSWWPTSFLAASAAMAQPLARALTQVRSAIDALLSDGLPPHRIWLAGFSQGAGLALETFARLDLGLAGVFGLSGALIGTSDLPGDPRADLYGHADKRFDYTGRRDGTKVWMSVHEQDPHIPLARAKASAAVFRAMGAEVDLHVESGSGHSVLAQDIAQMRAALHRLA